MQARPKILLASNFEEAAQLVQEYRDYIFGLVSDVEFPWEGKLSPEAGFELARMVKSLTPDVPVVLQTSRTEFRPRAHAEGYSFLRKRSPTLLKDLRRILTDNFGFGDFVFRMPDQREVGRAKDLNELEETLQTLPADSLMYHAQRNHFSHWLMARTEFALAAKLQPAQGFRLQRARAPAPRSDRVHQRLPPRTERSPDRGLQARHIQALGIELPEDRFRFARGQSPRPGVRAASAAHAPHRATLSWRAHFGSSRSGDRDGHVRPVPRREQSERFRAALRRRQRDPAALPRCCAARPVAGKPEGISRRGAITRWRCAHRACSKTRSTSPSPVSTRRSCWATSRPRLQTRLDELSRGDQARLRVDLQPACEGVCARHAVPAGRREDGGDSAAGGGHCARDALLSGFLRRGALAQFLSRGADDFRRRHRRGRPGSGSHGGRWRQVPEFLSALSAKPAAVLVGGRHSGEHADRVLRARTRWCSPRRRPRPSARSALRS